MSVAEIRERDRVIDQPGEQEFAAIAFIDRRTLLRLYDQLAASNAALTGAAEHAREVLSTLYAKYGTAIGPYSSQAQKCNVELGAALASARQANKGET